MVEINKQFIKKELQILFDNVSDRIIDNLYNKYDIEKLYHDLSKDDNIDIRLGVTIKINDSGYNNIHENIEELDWYNKYQIFSSVPTEQKQKEEDDCPELIPVPAPSQQENDKRMISIEELRHITEYLHMLLGYQISTNSYITINVRDMVIKLQQRMK